MLHPVRGRHANSQTMNSASQPYEQPCQPMLRLGRAYKADFGRVVLSIRHVKGRAAWMSRNAVL